MRITPYEFLMLVIAMAMLAIAYMTYAVAKDQSDKQPIGPPAAYETTEPVVTTTITMATGSTVARQDRQIELSR